MQGLAEQIELKTGADIGLNRRLVLFGQADCAAAAAQIASFVESKLASQIREVLFVAIASAGAFGLHLSDGRRVFLKIHTGEHPRDRLEAIHDAQELLRQRGIPAARRILPITEFRDGLFASVHAFRDRGQKLRASQKGCIEAAARGLARFDEAAKDISTAEMRSTFEKLRNPIYTPAAGAPRPPKRIEAVHARKVGERVAEKARSLGGAAIVSHGDWASRNLRFWNGDVSSIFDFEALVSGPQPYLLGRSAILFVNESSGLTNPADAAARFIETYEQTQGHVFEGNDAEALDAGVAYAVAQYLSATVRSGHVQDEEAPEIFNIFMRKFRARFQRYVPPEA